MEIIKIFLIS